MFFKGEKKRFCVQTEGLIQYYIIYGLTQSDLILGPKNRLEYNHHQKPF